MAEKQATVQIGSWKPGRGGILAIRVVVYALLAWIFYMWPPWLHWPMWTAAALWLGFSTYWSNQAKNSAATKSSETAGSRRLHEALVQGALLLLFIPLPGLRQALLPPSPWWVPAGLAMEAAGLGIAVWARQHLGQNWSGRIEVKVEHELIRTGPYRKLRHPIYTGMLMMYLGTAVVSGTGHAALALALALLAYARKIRLEEANLNAAFGPEYAAYRKQSWSLIPGLY